MPSDQEKIIAFINDLAGAVVRTMKGGSPEDKARLVETLKVMESKMPSVSEDTADAKEFLRALIGLLEGNPVSAGGLEEPYAGIYASIITQTLASAGPKEEKTAESALREFLTQLSATVVLVMKKGTGEDKLGLAEKLREIQKGMPREHEDAGRLVLALASLLEDAPVDPGSLPAVYADFFLKVIDAIRSNSR